MKPTEFKDIRSKISTTFKNILKNSYTDFKEINPSETKGQIFTLNIFYSEEYIDNEGKPMDGTQFQRPILSFQASEPWKNSFLDINRFYQIDDEILTEFYEMSERNAFDELLPILKESVNFGTPKKLGQSHCNQWLFLTVDSSISGGTQFDRDLLHEGIAIIEYDSEEDSILVSTVQSERNNITAKLDDKAVKLRIPFDKVELFKTFEKESKELNVDDSYIFVAMSFSENPALQDTYTTIKRVVNGMNKGLKCERVDDIQDDFIITDKILECIQKSKVFIVDLTENRPNVYYELGYAKALGKKTILISMDGQEPHFDVRNQNIIFYKNSTTLESLLRTRLRAMFQ